MTKKCECNGTMKYHRIKDEEGTQSHYYECDKCGVIRAHRKTNIPYKCPTCKRTYVVYQSWGSIAEYYPWKTYGLPQTICPECEEEQ